MENLSETVSGRFSTAMDNVTLALGEFAEKVWLARYDYHFAGRYDQPNPAHEHE